MDLTYVHGAEIDAILTALAASDWTRRAPELSEWVDTYRRENHARASQNARFDSIRQ